MSDPIDTPAEVVAPEDVPAVTATPAYSNVRAMIESNPAFLQGVRDYYSEKRAEYLQQLADIESFIGFTISEEQLSVRVAKIEQFLGIKS